MFCKECGAKLEKGTKFCSSCGTSCGETKAKSTKKVTKELPKDEILEKDRKVFKIVSYLGLLWILGLFCGSKNDSKVRFHVGQGIILTIAIFAASIVVGILSLIIVSTCAEVSFFGITAGVNMIGKVLLAIIYIAYYGAWIFYTVLGIVNAAKGKENKLPLIGNLAFYK